MIDRILSTVVTIAAIIAAVLVDTHGGDPTPYVGLASAALGYGAGHEVAKARAKRQG